MAVLPVPAWLRDSDPNFDQAVIGWRRHLHRYPELSFHEVETAAYVAGELSAMGLDPARPLPNAVVAELQGASPGPTVALRADLDALPVAEETGLPFASSRPGVMHACGHDGHTAMLLGAARLLLSHRETLAGRVRLLFQPAEETPPGGALPLMEAGALEGVDAILGLHLWAWLPAGTVGISPGPVMASGDRFRIVVRGQGGHGGMPHTAVDPVWVAAQVILALQGIVGRNVDPLRSAVLSVGTVHAGGTFNVIPDTVEISGTARALDQATRETLQARVSQVAQGLALAAGATAEVTYELGYPVLENDPAVAALVAAACREMLGDDRVTSPPPSLVSEDFGYYLRRVPGAYLFLGIRNPEAGATWPHHHPRFTVDEQVLPLGSRLLAYLALALLAEREGSSSPA